MSLGRRDFIKTAAAFGAAGPVLAQGASAPNLRVGILSDIHVTALSNADWFEKALRYFDERKVDAVLITGDHDMDGFATVGAKFKTREIASEARTTGKAVVRRRVMETLDGIRRACRRIPSKNDNSAVDSR